MKLFLIIVGLLFCNGLSAQVLDNREGQAFTDAPFFNTDFIKTNKLKSLQGTYVYKREGEPMYTTKYKYVYQFNPDGELVSNYETKADDGTLDTIWSIFEYDSVGNLAKHRKTDQEGYFTIAYEYDSLGRIVHEEYLRDIEDSTGKIVRTLMFNEEEIKYKDLPQQIRRTRYNNYGLPYLDEYYNYNDLGYLVERIERVKMTGLVYTFHYEYNEKGKLAAIRKSSNKKEGYIEELLFRYDELGNLIEKHVYKNGVFTTDYQIVYNSKTKLLSSVITRQVSTNFMTIIRFLDYEFYN